MYFLQTCIALSLATAIADRDPASLQLINFKKQHEKPIGIMTTSWGSPIGCNELYPLNEDLYRNNVFLDWFSHFVKERIPPRIFHAKGAGGFGYFEVTHDVTMFCKANFLSHIGKKTPIAIRLGPAIPEKGGSDTARTLNGFAVKFYTQEGNWDIVGFNSPMLFTKNPIDFIAAGHAFKPNPVTNFVDLNMVWDIMTKRPEGLFNFLWLLADKGTPAGYQHMAGFSIHTYQVYNEKGESYFMRIHIIPDAGIKSLNTEEATRLGQQDPDYLMRDFYNSIANGTSLSWTMKFQVLTEEEVDNADFDVFDITRTLPESKYPLLDVGKLIINANPQNYFKDVEQMALCPGHLVPGILGAPDIMFAARLMAYRDAAIHRLGGNFDKIAINRPLSCPLSYNRDGTPPVGDNMKGVPNYWLNSYNGPTCELNNNIPKMKQIIESEPNNTDLIIEFYEELTKEEKNNLTTNIVDSLQQVDEFIKKRVVKVLSDIHAGMGNKVARALVNAS